MVGQHTVDSSGARRGAAAAAAVTAAAAAAAPPPAAQQQQQGAAVVLTLQTCLDIDQRHLKQENKQLANDEPSKGGGGARRGLFCNAAVARALAAACLCSFATGWLIGVWGGVSAMPAFAAAFFPETAAARAAAAAADSGAAGTARYCLFNDQLLSLGGSVIYPAALPALAVAGRATHAYGRVPTMWAIAALLAVGAAIGAAAPATRAGLGAVFASRALMGAAMGCSFQAPTMLLAEVAPRSLRGRAMFTNNLALLSGFLLSAVANQALSAHAWGWRASAGLTAAPALALAALLPAVRESAQVLLQRGDAAGARAALVAARPRGADVEAELRQIAAAATAAAAPRAARFSALRGHAPAVTASVLYPLTLMLSGLSALSGWTPNLLLALGASPRGAYAGNTAMMAAGLAAAVIGTPFVDRVGRRTLLLAGSATIVATLTAVAALLAVYLPGTPGAPPPPRALLPVAVALLCLNRAALSSTLQPLAVTVPAEVQPLAVRSQASALTTAVRNGASFFVTQFALPLLCAARWGLFLALAGATAAGAGALLALVPETRGLALEAVHEAYARHWLWGRRHCGAQRHPQGDEDDGGDSGCTAAHPGSPSPPAAAAPLPDPELPSPPASPLAQAGSGGVGRRLSARASLESCRSVTELA